MLHEHNGDQDRPELVPGARVRVIKDPEWNGPWPSEPLGVIEKVGNDNVVMADSPWGPVRQYFVRFQSPQRDADGDGPFTSALIWQQYLRVEPSPSQPSPFAGSSG